VEFHQLIPGTTSPFTFYEARTRVLLGTLTVAQPVKIFPGFYAILGRIAGLTRAATGVLSILT
jgi:hypothetical protein